MLLQAQKVIDCLRNKLKLDEKVSVCCPNEALEEPSSKPNGAEWEASNFRWLPATQRMESSGAPELLVTTESWSQWPRNMLRVLSSSYSQLQTRIFSSSLAGVNL